MIKKIFVGVLLAGVFGLLVFGAVNRTLAKTSENVYQTTGQSLAAGNNVGDGNGAEPIRENRSTNLNLSENIGQSGQRAVTSGIGQGGQNEDAPGDGTSTGIAEVDEWLTITGTVASTDPDLWVVTLTDGTSLEIEGRALNYLAELNFTVSPEDSLSLQVFLEDQEYEIGEIENLTTGEVATIRDESGRPLWAGGRQGGR